MATEVAEAMEDGRHLLVQAGTALASRSVPRPGDAPRTSASWSPRDAAPSSTSSSSATSRAWSRRSRACWARHVVRRPQGAVQLRLPAPHPGRRPDDQGTLVDVRWVDGEKVLELRAWAEEESERAAPGERDNAPRHTDARVAAKVASPPRVPRCVECPFARSASPMFAREKAQRSHLIVTNHSLLAIDAIEDVPMIPDYDTVVIDEAHELTARVTQAATDELAAADIERAARRSSRWTADAAGDPAGDLEDAAGALAEALEATPPGRIDQVSTQLADALGARA